MHLPSKQEFYQNPIGWLSAIWVLASAIAATLVPRATVIFLILAGISILAHSIHKKSAPLFPPRFFVGALAGFLILAVLSLLWSVAPDETLRRLPRTSTLFLFGLLALAATRHATPKIADWAMTLTTLALVIAFIFIAIENYSNFAIYRTFIAPLKQPTVKAFKTGTFINQPALLFALFLWPAALTLWVKGFRILSISFIGLSLILFVPSNSQSVGVALFAGSLACGLTALFPRVMKIWLSFAIISLMIALPWIPKFLQSLFTGYEDWIPLSGLHRLEIWDFVVGKISEKPLMGYGLEASRILGRDEISTVIPGATLFSLHPHNGFLQVWLELGLGGYVILGLLCLWLTHRISQLEGANKAFATGFFVCALSLFSTAYGMWQSWLIAAEFSAAGALLLSLKLAQVPQHYER